MLVVTNSIDILNCVGSSVLNEAVPCLLQIFPNITYHLTYNLSIFCLFQVLTLEWSSGMETLRCVGRTDLTLTGSFADMVLVPSAGSSGNNKKTDIFVLTSPGELHFYDDASLSTLTSQQERKPSFSPVEFPAVIPVSDPTITIAKLINLPPGVNSLKTLSEVLLLYFLSKMAITSYSSVHFLSY